MRRQGRISSHAVAVQNGCTKILHPRSYGAQAGGANLLDGILQPCPRAVHLPGSDEADQASRISSICCEETYGVFITAPSGKTPWVT